MAPVTLSETGAWTWFHNPQAVYGNNTTYFGWSYNGVQIGAYNHADGTIQTHELLSSGNNDHNVAALGIRPDGRLLAAYAPHNGAMRTVVSTNPHDITSWGTPVEIDATDATYPNLFYLASEDRWHLIYRQGPVGDWPTRWRTSDDGGATWSAATTLFSNGTARPYMQVVGDGTNQLHLSLTDGHPNASSNRSIYHLRYDAGTWRDSTGTDLGTPPFGPADVTTVYDGSGALGRAWCWDIALDAGNPVMVFASFPTDDDHRYHYARFNGTTWDVEQITAAGTNIYHENTTEAYYSAGLCLNQDDPDIVYLSREVSTGVYELERWTKGGGEWTSEAITSGSDPSPFKNFRPYVPRGDSPFEVIWAAGDYTTYVNYTGGVLGLLSAATQGRFAVRGGVLIPAATSVVRNGTLVPAS